MISPKAALDRLKVAVSPAPVVSPNPGQLYFMTHDGKPRNKDGDPETIKPLKDGFIELTKPLVEYWQALLWLGNPGMSQADFYRNWRSLTSPARAFNNKDSNHIENLGCGGMTVRAVSGQPIKKVLKLWLEVYAIDIRKSLPPIPAAWTDIDWTIHFQPTIATRFYNSAGVDIVDPFPQFNGRCVVPCFSKTGTNFFPYSRLVMVNSVQNPFVS